MCNFLTLFFFISFFSCDSTDSDFAEEHTKSKAGKNSKSSDSHFKDSSNITFKDLKNFIEEESNSRISVKFANELNDYAENALKNSTADNYDVDDIIQIIDLLIKKLPQKSVNSSTFIYSLDKIIDFVKANKIDENDKMRTFLAKVIKNFDKTKSKTYSDFYKKLSGLVKEHNKSAEKELELTDDEEEGPDNLNNIIEGSGDSLENDNLTVKILKTFLENSCKSKINFNALMSFSEKLDSISKNDDFNKDNINCLVEILDFLTKKLPKTSKKSTEYCTILNKILDIISESEFINDADALENLKKTFNDFDEKKVKTYKSFYDNLGIILNEETLFNNKSEEENEDDDLDNSIENDNKVNDNSSTLNSKTDSSSKKIITEKSIDKNYFSNLETFIKENLKSRLSPKFLSDINEKIQTIINDKNYKVINDNEKSAMLSAITMITDKFPKNPQDPGNYTSPIEKLLDFIEKSALKNDAIVKMKLEECLKNFCKDRQKNYSTLYNKFLTITNKNENNTIPSGKEDTNIKDPSINNSTASTNNCPLNFLQNFLDKDSEKIRNLDENTRMVISTNIDLLIKIDAKTITNSKTLENFYKFIIEKLPKGKPNYYDIRLDIPAKISFGSAIEKFFEYIKSNNKSFLEMKINKNNQDITAKEIFTKKSGYANIEKIIT